MTRHAHNHADPAPDTRLRAARWLDPRPAERAARHPLPEAVNIPLDELAARTQELPPRDRQIVVAADDDLAAATVTRLRELGRSARAVPPPASRTDGGRWRLWQPTAVLEAWLADLPRGSSLDLACGSGRDVVFLAAAGWRASGVDWLPDAIERGRALAGRYLDEAARITWLTRDLEAEDLTPPGRYDLVTGFRFLHRPLLRHLRDWLAPGGCLVWETFTTEHRARHGRPRRDAFVLSPGELPTLCAGLAVLRYEEGWHGAAHTARILCRREDGPGR